MLSRLMLGKAMTTLPGFIMKDSIFATFILAVCARKAIVYFVFRFLIRNNLKEAERSASIFVDKDGHGDSLERR